MHESSATVCSLVLWSSSEYQTHQNNDCTVRKSGTKVNSGLWPHLSWLQIEQKQETQPWICMSCVSELGMEQIFVWFKFNVNLSLDKICLTAADLQPALWMQVCVADCYTTITLCTGCLWYITVDLLSTLIVAVPMGSWLICYIPTGSPTSSSSSSFCFNEAPGRFWKALELNAVHPVQTAASSSVPASLDQTLLCLLHTAPSPRQLQTGRDRVLVKTGLWFQQMSRRTENRNA